MHMKLFFLLVALSCLPRFAFANDAYAVGENIYGLVCAKADRYGQPYGGPVSDWLCQGGSGEYALVPNILGINVCRKLENGKPASKVDRNYCKKNLSFAIGENMYGRICARANSNGGAYGTPVDDYYCQGE